MSLTLLLQAVFINTPEDFQLIGTQPTDYFIINNSLTLTYTETQIQTFSGQLTGGLHILTIQQNAPNIYFIKTLSGKIKQLQITQQVAENPANFIFGALNSANLSEFVFSSKIISTNSLSLANMIVNSNLANISIFHSIQTSNSISGLSNTFMDNTAISIQIQITASSTAGIHGISPLLQSEIQAKIEIISALGPVFGVGENIMTAISGIQIKITAAETIYGVGKMLQFSVSNSFIQIKFNGKTTNSVVFGVAESVQSVQNLTISFSGILSSESTNVTGICSICTVSNAILYIQIELNVTKFQADFGSQTMKNSSIYLNLSGKVTEAVVEIMGSCETASYIWSILEVLNFTGKLNFGLFGGDKVRKIENCYEILKMNEIDLLDRSKVSGLGMYCSNVQVLNFTFNIQIQWRGNGTGKVEVSSLGYLISSSIQNILVQVNSSIMDYNSVVSSGFLELDDVNLDIMVIIGYIQLNGTGSGIVHTMIDSTIRYVLLNLNMSSRNVNREVSQWNKNALGSCNIGYILSYSLVFDVVNQTYPFNYDIFPMSVYLLNTPEANCYDDCATYDQFKNETFMKYVMNTGKFVVDDFNFNCPHLIGFYTMHQNGTIERNPYLQSPFGYDKELNGIISGLANICGGDCHGQITPESTICGDGYSGDFCLEFDCSLCQNGVCNNNQCNCHETFYGDLCENSMCNICYQETCSALNISFIQCSIDCTDQCNGGDCVNNYCACGEGYIGKLCEEYNCTLDSNPCNKLGSCSADKCSCDLGSTIMFQNCKECPEIFNGVCDPDKLECDEGFELPTCELFECQNDIMCGNTACLEGQCQCKQWFNQVNNYCIDICPEIKKFSPQQFYSLNILNGILHGTVYQLNDSISNKTRSNLCVIVCQQCDCNQTSCICPGIVQFVNTTEGLVCNGCHSAYTGARCDECATGFLLFNNQCFRPCPTCHGTCYYNYENAIECLACIQGYQGIQCLECESSYVFDTGLCYPICYDCNGNCYTKNGVPICEFCLEGYNGPSCTDCDSVNGFDYAFNGCYQRCNNCSMGICYQLNQSFACTSCFFNLVGSQCNLCQEGFVMYQETCKPQIGPDQCFDDGSGNILCIACVSDKILVNDECQQRCDKPECTGECYFVGNDYKCVYCFSGIVINNKCYDKIYNAHGDCYQLKDDIRCNCLIGFSGISCEICEGILISGQCYLPKPDSNGDCYFNALNENKISCFSCEIQYELPLCVECSFGYLMGSDGKCSQCMPSFINTSTLPPEIQAELGENACVLRCEDCVQGECYYSGDEIQCFQCQVGFTGKCFVCEDGYQLIGSYCLKNNSECSINAAIDETLCMNCSETQLSFNCSFCSLEFTFDKCRVHAPIDAGKCFSDDGMVYCDEQEPCLYKLSNSSKCIQCNPALVTMNDTCWYEMKPENTRYRGECFTGSGIICQTCENGWNGSLCNKCANSYTICPCATDDIFTQCCCEITHREIGLCFVNHNDKVTCNQCSGSLVLEDEYCVSRESQSLVSWFISIIMLIIVILIIIIIFFSMNKTKRNIIKIKIKRTARHIGLRLFFVILAQIDSVIIALQDVYINDFFMQAIVSFVSSFPFLLVLIIGQLPRSKKYYFNTIKDLFLFVVVSLVELTFHLVQYMAIPDQLEVGQQIYKLISPPVIMLAFIFFAVYKFQSQQITALFVAISLPIIYQVSISIIDTATPLFFVGLTSGRLISGEFILAINILILSSQYYLTEIVLSKYTGLDAITRLATVTFIIYLIIFILNPSEMIASVLDFKIFSICVIMQMIFNVANMIIMINISAVEFAINTISSAIWVEFIEAIGKYVIMQKNYVQQSLSEIIIVTIQMLVVMMALVVFNYYSSVYNEKHNKMRDLKDKQSNGVYNIFGNRIKQRRQFYSGAKAGMNTQINANIGNQMMKEYQMQQNSIPLQPINSQATLLPPRNPQLRVKLAKRMQSFAPNTKIVKTTQNINVANITDLQYKVLYLDNSDISNDEEIKYLDQE